MIDFIDRHITYRLLYLVSATPPFYSWHLFHREEIGYWQFWWPTWVVLLISLVMVEWFHYTFNKKDSSE